MIEKIAQITNSSPIFKGLGLVVLASFALLFAYWMDKKYKEPKTFFYFVFIGLAVFILFFGFYILLFKPNWWVLPY